jgi:hypothetical protein
VAGSADELAYAQAAAAILGVPARSVVCVAADTDSAPYLASDEAKASGAAGRAVEEVAALARERIRTAGAAVLGVPLSQATLAGGKVLDGNGRAVSFGEIGAAALRVGQPLAVTATPVESETGHSLAAALADVTVDVETGAVHVQRLQTVVAGGPFPDARPATGLVEGALLAALERALAAGTTFDEEGPAARHVAAADARGRGDRRADARGELRAARRPALALRDGGARRGRRAGGARRARQRDRARDREPASRAALHPGPHPRGRPREPMPLTRHQDVPPSPWPKPASALRHVMAEGYSRKMLRADLLAGAVVGIVALPLSMALAIASGVAPEHGLYTAIVAGGLIPLLGGSRFQVSGPDGGLRGDPVADLAPLRHRRAGAGDADGRRAAVRHGRAAHGPHDRVRAVPVTTGFTAGIAVVIATLQLKDLLGLEIPQMPEHFVERVQAIALALPGARRRTWRSAC